MLWNLPLNQIAASRASVRRGLDHETEAVGIDALFGAVFAEILAAACRRGVFIL